MPQEILLKIFLYSYTNVFEDKFIDMKVPGQRI
jgi:hypothetical protein